MRAAFCARLASLLRHFLDVPARSELRAVRSDVAELAAIECLRAAAVEAEQEYHRLPSEKNGRRVSVLREEERELCIGYGRRRGART